MKINEVIVESTQLDELSAGDIARGVGTAVGKTAQAAGAVAGGLKGAWDAGKAGYQSGKAFVGGQRVGAPSPRKTTSRAPAATQAPASRGSNLDSMADQDLEAMKSKIDSVLAARKGQSASQAQAGAPAAAPNATAQGNAPAASSKPVQGQMATVNGKDYMFAGNAWVDEKNAVAKGNDLKQIKDMFARGEIGPPPTERPAKGQSKADGMLNDLVGLSKEQQKLVNKVQNPQQQSAKQTPIPSAQDILKALSKLKPDQVEAIRDMLTAKIQGQQNVAEGVGSAIKGAWNKLTGRGGLSFDAIKQAIDQMTPDVAKDLLAQLPAPATAKTPSAGSPAPAAPGTTKTPGVGSAAPAATQTIGKVTSAAGQNIGSAPSPLGAPTLQPKEPGYITSKIPAQSSSATASPAAPSAAPAAPAAKSPYGKLTPGQQAYKKAREEEGVEPDIIKAALDNGAGGGGPRPPLPRTAQLNTIGDTPGFKPDSIMSQVDRKSFDDGQKKKAELDAKSAAAVAARKAARQQTTPATNEGFYSRFLGKNI